VAHLFLKQKTAADFRKKGRVILGMYLKPGAVLAVAADLHISKNLDTPSAQAGLLQLSLFYRAL
jgi:hypothetical protein